MKTAIVKNKKLTLFLFLLLSAMLRDLPPHAQTGGSYRIEKSVIASGGSSSTGASYSLVGTIGQAVAGPTQSSPYVVHAGFWIPALAPTAASVSVAGRVLTPDGRGLMNASVTMTDRFGNTRSARTSTFGYYRFEEVEVGSGYIFLARSKQYRFASVVISIVDEITNLDFTAEPER